MNELSQHEAANTDMELVIIPQKLDLLIFQLHPNQNKTLCIPAAIALSEISLFHHIISQLTSS